MTVNKPAGVKFDKEKLRWDLFPFKALESTVRVLMMGSEKYEDNNWKYVKGCKKRYYSAAMRHLTDWQEGEILDPESGETHLAHALCCIIFLAWHEMNQTKEFTEEEDEEDTTDDTDKFDDVEDAEITEIEILPGGIRIPPHPDEMWDGHSMSISPSDVVPVVKDCFYVGPTEYELKVDPETGNGILNSVPPPASGKGDIHEQTPRPPRVAVVPTPPPGAGVPLHAEYRQALDEHGKLCNEVKEREQENDRPIFSDALTRFAQWYQDL